MGRLNSRLMWLAACTSLLLASRADAATLHEPLLQLSAEEKYDDDPVVGRGGAGLMTKLSPELGYRQKNEARLFEARYAADLIEHLLTGDHAVDHRARLNWREGLTERLSFHTEGSFFRVADATSIPRLGVARVRAPALWIQERAAASYRVSRRDTAEVGYSGELTKVYGAEFPLGLVHAPYALVRHALTQRLSLGVKYRYQIFTSNMVVLDGAHGAFGVARFQVTRHLWLSAEGGPMLFQPNVFQPNVFQPYAGTQGTQAVVPRVHGEINFEGRGVELGLSGGRDLVGAAGYATAIWANYAQLGAAWRLNPLFSVFAGGGYFRNGLAPFQPVTAQGYGVSVGGEWRVATGLSTYVVYDRLSQTDVGGGGLQLGRNIVTLRLAWQPMR